MRYEIKTTRKYNELIRLTGANSEVKIIHGNNPCAMISKSLYSCIKEILTTAEITVTVNDSIRDKVTLSVQEGNYRMDGEDFIIEQLSVSCELIKPETDRKPCREELARNYEVIAKESSIGGVLSLLALAINGKYDTLLGDNYLKKLLNKYEYNHFRDCMQANERYKIDLSKKDTTDQD